MEKIPHQPKTPVSPTSEANVSENKGVSKGEPDTVRRANRSKLFKATHQSILNRDASIPSTTPGESRTKLSQK